MRLPNNRIRSVRALCAWAPNEARERLIAILVPVVTGGAHAARLPHFKGQRRRRQPSPCASLALPHSEFPRPSMGDGMVNEQPARRRSEAFPRQNRRQDGFGTIWIAGDGQVFPLSGRPRPRGWQGFLAAAGHGIRRDSEQTVEAGMGGAERRQIFRLAVSQGGQVGDVAQSVRALPCHGRGREFESRRPRHSFQRT